MFLKPTFERSILSLKVHGSLAADTARVSLSQVRYYLIKMIAGYEIRIKKLNFNFSLEISCVGVFRHPHTHTR